MTNFRIISHISDNLPTTFPLIVQKAPGARRLHGWKIKVRGRNLEARYGGNSIVVRLIHWPVGEMCAIYFVCRPLSIKINLALFAYRLKMALPQLGIIQWATRPSYCRAKSRNLWRNWKSTHEKEDFIYLTRLLLSWIASNRNLEDNPSMQVSKSGSIISPR